MGRTVKVRSVPFVCLVRHPDELSQSQLIASRLPHKRSTLVEVPCPKLWSGVSAEREAGFREIRVLA